MNKIDANSTVNSTELACVLPLSVRRVQQLTQDGTLSTCSRGRYVLANAVRQYIDFALASAPAASDKSIDKTRARAEAQIKQAKAVIAKLEADELQGKMHRSEDVQAIIDDLVTTLRGMLQALPGRLAVDVLRSVSTAEAATIIRDAIYSVMDEMSRYQYSPEPFKQRVRDRKKWEPSTVIDDD